LVIAITIPASVNRQIATCIQNQCRGIAADGSETGLAATAGE
jgi:hypothetical protein